MQFDHPNDKTVEAYNQEISHYLARTPSHYNHSHLPMIGWIETSLKLIPDQGKILEIGSGPGRDAKYIKEKGYDVLCSDAAGAFVEHLEKGGHDAILLNVLRDPIPEKYHLIFGNAVIQHFTSDDLSVLFQKIRTALLRDGIFAFSAKQGEGEVWIHEKLQRKRYIKYWQPDELKKILHGNGYEILFAKHDIPGDLPSHIWSLFIVRPIE